jgi:Tfp pilus assembly protein PilZ
MLRRQQSGFDRVPFVQICDFEGGGSRRRALLCNLSVLGAYVHMVNPPAAGSEVTLSFRLPDDGALVLAEAQVTWVNDSPAESVTAMPVGCGVRFTSVAPDDVRRIALLARAFLAAPAGEALVGVGVPRTGIVRIPFIAACAFQGEEGEASGSVCNLSVLGVYVALDRIPEVGERGRIIFPIPGFTKPLVAEVTVAWHNPEFARRMQALPPGCGLRFEGLTASDRERLSDIVEAYLTSPETAKTDLDPKR